MPEIVVTSEQMLEIDRAIRELKHRVYKLEMLTDIRNANMMTGKPLEPQK